jgi:hypothetical protein
MSLPRREQALPILTEARILKQDPIDIVPKTVAILPTRVVALTDNVDPRLIQSKTDIIALRRASGPNNETDEPNLLKLLTDMQDPN